MCTELLILNLLQQNLELRHQLYTCALTGIGSRYAYQQRLHQGEGISYIVVDVDKFKLVNDTYGHQAGDQVLAAIAGIIRSETDHAYRTGGDEFVAVLDAPLSDAAAVAERIEAAVQATPVCGFQCSVSVGVGLCEKSADADMYQRKRAAAQAIYSG